MCVCVYVCLMYVMSYVCDVLCVGCVGCVWWVCRVLKGAHTGPRFGGHSLVKYVV